MTFRLDRATALALALGTGLAQAQGGQMMNGGGWYGSWMGGSGGVWMPILLLVIVALVVWVVMQRRKQIGRIRDEVNKSHWQLMNSMHQQGKHMDGGFGPGALDEAGARKDVDSMHATQKAKFELSLGARKRIDAVATTAQPEQLHRKWTPR
jgi:uncharacterized membrane protein